MTNFFVINFTMKIWILSATILFIVVSGDESLSTRKNKELNNKFARTLDSNQQKLATEGHIKGHYESVITRNTTPKFKESKRETSFSDDYSGKRLPRSPPKNKPDLGPILNFFLVMWQCLRDQLLNGEVNFDTLLIYAERVLNSIECAYFDGMEDLIFDLHVLWQHRAKVYFPRNEDLRKYIERINSMHEPMLSEDIDLFIKQLSAVLNGQTTAYLPESYLNRLRDIHVLDTRENAGRHDYYILYSFLGINAESYYLEFHVTEGFRVLFAILEILEINFLNDTEETCNVSNVPEVVTEFLKNNTAYSIYLLNKKHKELSLIGKSKNKFKKNLEKEARVSDPDLMMLTWTRIKNFLESRTSAIISSTTTSTTSTTVVDYVDTSKEKGKLPVEPSEKFYPKRKKLEHNIDNENPGTSGSSNSNSQQQAQEQPRTIDICSDYIMCSDDLLQLPFQTIPTEYEKLDGGKRRILSGPSGQCILKKPKSCVIDNEIPSTSGIQSSLQSWRENRNKDTSSSEDEESDERKRKISKGHLKKCDSKKLKIYQYSDSDSPGTSDLETSLNLHHRFQISDTSSSEDEETSKGKGKISKGSKANCSSKKSKTCHNIDQEQQPSTSGSQPASTDDDYYGYLTWSNDDLDHVDVDELKFFLETLDLKFDGFNPFANYWNRF